jgi:uncharacterized protein with HEPN domain
MGIPERDLLRLLHMRDYAREVIAFTSGATRPDLDTNRVLLRALEMSVGIIGEAVSQISPGFQEAHAQIPWEKIIGMRNFLFHAYFMVKNDILWDTATTSVPALLAEVEKILPRDEGRTP